MLNFNVMEKLPRYNGKVMSKKQYDKRINLIERNKSRKKNELKDCGPECIVEGRRIVEVKVSSKLSYRSNQVEKINSENKNLISW